MKLRSGLLLAGALVAVGCDREPAPSRADVAAPTSGRPAWLEGTDDERFAAVERHLRGFDLAMVETAYRYGELHAAGQDRNWGYVLYQAGKIRTAIDNGSERRPARAASATMIDAPLSAIEAAARSEDPTAFDAAFVSLTTTCNACHVAERVPFMHVVPPPVRTSTVVGPAAR